MKKLLRALMRLGLLGLSVLLSAEILLRILQPTALQYYRNVKLLHIYHPDYLVGLAPNADLYIRHHLGLWEGRFTTNSLGYRGSPEPDVRGPQLACLGDSLVMGFGVSDEQTFCSLLNGITLNKTSHQAMNLAVDAFGSMGSAKRLAEAAPRLNIRIALFFISPNDFTLPEQLRAWGHLSDDEKDALREKDRGHRFWFRLQFELTRVSYALHAMKLSLEQLRIRWVETRAAIRGELIEMGFLEPSADESANRPLRRCAGRPINAPAPERNLANYALSSFYRYKGPDGCGPPRRAPTVRRSYDPRTQRHLYCPETVHEGTVCENAPPADRDLEPLLDATIRAYRLMIATAHRHNFRLVPVMLPVMNESVQCIMNGKHSRYFNYALRARRFFRDRGIEVMDLRPYVGRMCGEPIPTPDGRGEPSRIRHYFIPADGHFTVWGNGWAARALREELLKRAARWRAN